MLSETAGMVQRHDPDRFTTSLFAPSGPRAILHVLYAFNHELARAREVASNPTLALIRLAWWRDVVEGAVRHHEVALPLRAALDAGALDRAALLTMIDGRMREAEPEIDEAGWHDHVRETGGTLMAAAARVLMPDADVAAAMQAGAGCAAVGLIRNQEAHRAQGRWSFPAGRTADWAREQALVLLGRPRRWPKPMLAAVLPLVLARRDLPAPRRRPDRRPDPGGLLALLVAAARGRC
jgi:phytoene synthase